MEAVMGRLRGRRALAALAMLVSARVVCAQPADTTTKRTVLSINPLGIPLEYVTVELERATGARFSAGVTGTYFGGFRSDFGVASADAKVRFYPNEKVLSGFSLGLAGGVLRASDVYTVSCGPTSCVDERRSVTSPTL
ncbi:MAG: hypothetical protein MUE41_08100, partial [Gemmatimonadaceae bacterium]|nr:hypothetical protein [Gemmatimonadaceae bacterium]